MAESDRVHRFVMPSLSPWHRALGRPRLQPAAALQAGFTIASSLCDRYTGVGEQEGGSVSQRLANRNATTLSSAGVPRAVQHLLPVLGGLVRACVSTMS